MSQTLTPPYHITGSRVYRSSPHSLELKIFVSEGIFFFFFVFCCSKLVFCKICYLFFQNSMFICWLIGNKLDFFRRFAVCFIMGVRGTNRIGDIWDIRTTFFDLFLWFIPWTVLAKTHFLTWVHPSTIIYLVTSSRAASYRVYSHLLCNKLINLNALCSTVA